MFGIISCFSLRYPMLLRCVAIFLSCLFCFPFAANAAKTSPLPVVVSIAPQKYLLERIAGDHIKVSVLVSPGADPHSYEPGPSVMRDSANAKAWFTIGIPFEDIWLERIRKLSPGLAVISSIQDIQRLPFNSLEHAGAHKRQAGEKESHPDHKHSGDGHEQHDVGHGHDHDHTGLDPHIWLSPMLVREILPNLARELGRLMPEKATEFRSNARAFAAELEKLDQEIAERFLPIPEEKRVFLTFHPAWQYFALNYQLKELSIEVEGKEPGPRGMKAVIDSARQYGVTTIFIEPQFSKNAARAIAQSLNAEVIEADPLAEDLPRLYRDMTEKLVNSFNR
jgi:ABC-type metal ion transport system, periplasmic component/surface adhesin